MRHYDLLLREQRGPFTVVVDKTWEDLSPADLFEPSDVGEICRKIDSCELDWFMLRVRILFQDVELSSEYLGGCCYEDAKQVLTDGTAEDKIYEALLAAKQPFAELKEKFAEISVEAIDALLV